MHAVSLPTLLYASLPALVFFAVAPAATALQTTITADTDRVLMGRSVKVSATVRSDEGDPVPGCRVLSYVNERRWGSHEVTGENGEVLFLLPLPNPGAAEIRAEAVAPPPDAQWIWAQETRDDQRVVLESSFVVDGAVTRAALRVAVDDSSRILINGEPVGEVAGWNKEHVLGGLASRIRVGENTLTLEARNASGPAGVVALLTVETEHGLQCVGTGEAWVCRPEAGAAPVAVRVLGRPDETMPWWRDMGHWPGVIDRDRLFAGRPVPRDANLSNTVTVRVLDRAIPRRTALELGEGEPRMPLIGMQWEPWFTPRNAYWQTAQAVPVIGYYDSYNPDVMRQHALWFMDLGVDFIYVDWSNHIWGKKHWSERHPNTNEIIHATTLTLEAYAKMRDEGLPVPKVVIMPGLSNGPPTTMEALNEELTWIYENYLQNPRFEGLWLDFDGKPLVVPLDCAYLAIKEETPPVDDTHFTVRWMGTQLQATKMDEHGYWSWMDGSLRPIVTYRDGEPEVVTPTPAYFGHGGWLYPEARGRRGGTTFIESFKVALEERPRVILLHQWNEYAGQPEGHGYGPKKDIYVDSYSAELSDDLEPVSLAADGYRGDSGGWGFYYLNLTQALIRVLRDVEPRDTVMAVYPMARAQEMTEKTLPLEWSVIGKAPRGYSVLLDGKTVAVVEGLQEMTYALDLSRIAPGPHTVTVVAEGASTRFPLSLTEMDVVLDTPMPTRVEVPFVIKP